ncbi:MAG: flavin reductase family protein [Lentimicrobium sp.]|jgi:flavin reductase (DIM6/NTAB) family NADH-FMN oxidoreductase RutF|nr:flavin reductase family protein [Lentimicrobium sp.]
MKSDFNKVDISTIDLNAIDLIGKQWMLITAGTVEKYNTMTASWGGMGELWNKPVVFIFIRPQRFTYEFVEEHDYFTCCFFDKTYRKTLNYCGENSGREVDKAAETGLQPISSANGVIFKQARMYIECRKIYADDIKPEKFLINFIQKHYPLQDYHRMYIGEITEVGVKG